MLGLCVVAVLFTAIFVVILIKRSSTPTDAASSSHSSTTSSITTPPVTSTSATSATPSGTADPADETGSDDTGYPPPTPPEMQTVEGEIAYKFILAYNTYDPNLPGAGEAWRARWETYAGEQLITNYDKAALDYYFFTLQTSVTVQSPIVAAVTVSGGGGPTGTIYFLSIDRLLVPWYPTSDSDFEVQRVDWRVVVLDQGDGPKVTQANPGSGAGE